MARGVARRVGWLALLLAAAGLVAYANSFSAPFVFDDQDSILNNAHIRHLWPLRAALSGPVQSAVAGRPVVSLSLAINYATSGLSPVGFRAWNVAVHLLAGLVLFGVLRRAFLSPRLAPAFGDGADGLAFACALIWLVHPLHSEVVDYLTQRTESMMGLWYLLTLYAAIRAKPRTGGRARGWEAVAVGSCALGMATKESMATAPVMVLLYDAVFQSGSVGRALRTRAGMYAGLAATWIIVGVLASSGPRSHSAGLSSGLTPWSYLLNQPAMLIRYLKLAFWPRGLVLDYGLPQQHLTLPGVWPQGIVVLALIAAIALAWRYRPEVAFLGTWFFVTLAPTSSVIPIATEVGAERRMYLALAAVVTLSVAAGWKLSKANRWLTGSSLRRAEIAWLVVIGVALTGATLQRNAEYQSRTGIWQTVLERHPSGRAHYNLGLELKAQGRRDEAIREYRLALSDLPDAHYAVGFELDADGKREEAIAQFQEYIRLKPDDANVIRAYILLGHDLKIQGRLDEAVDAFRQAVVRQHSNIDARTALGETLLEQERFDEASQEFRELVRIQPNSANAHTNLAVALVGREKQQEALPEFARAAELAPNEASTHYNLGNVLANVGRLDEAALEYKRALAFTPNDVRVLNAFGLVLAAQGRGDEALAQFRRSMELDPANEETRSDFAAARQRLQTAK